MAQFSLRAELIRGGRWRPARAEEGRYTALLAVPLLSRASSLGPGSATEGHGHPPLQTFHEPKGRSVTPRKGPIAEVLLCFIPLHIFPLIFPHSCFISHFLLESPIPTASSEQPAVLTAEMFVPGRQRGSNFQFILISMASRVSGELH